jgi:hypothetical protein
MTQCGRMTSALVVAIEIISEIFTAVFDLVLLHVTRLDPMFGRDIHTMLRGLHFDRYAFPLLAIRSSQ